MFITSNPGVIDCSHDLGDWFVSVARRLFQKMHCFFLLRLLLRQQKRFLLLELVGRDPHYDRPRQTLVNPNADHGVPVVAPCCPGWRPEQEQERWLHQQ